MSAAEPALHIEPTTQRVQLSPRDPAFVQNPYAVYRRLRAAAPVFYWEDYRHWCCARFAEVNALLRDRRFGREVTHLASRAELGWPEIPERLAPFYAFGERSLLEREPPAHTRLRNLVTRAFVSRRIERLAPRIAALAHELIDSFERSGETDLLPAFATPIPIAVICELIGVPTEKAQQLLDWSHAMVAMYQFRRDRAVEDAAVAATLAFEAYLRGVVAERRRRPADDLVSHLVGARDGADALSEDELIANLIQLLNAGHEASVHAIANGVKALLEAPGDPRRWLAAAQAAATVEEILRFEPPLHLFTRYALEDLEIAGVALKRGDVIGLLLGSANHDEARYADADRFDPARAPRAHVAFGAGIHFCLGAPLARLEMQVALPILFERLPKLALAEPPRWRDSYHFHGLEALRVTW